MQGSALTSDVVRLVARAWQLADSDPDTALGSARKATETICLHAYLDTIAVGQVSLATMIEKLTRAQTLPHRLVAPLAAIRDAAPETDDAPMDGRVVHTCLVALDEVVRWYFTSYLSQPVPLELATREAAPVRAAMAATIRTRPIALCASARATYVGSDGGEWATVTAANELGALPSTGPFGAAVVDASGTLTVACWGTSVKQLRDAAWSEIVLGAPTLALADTARGLFAGDADGGLTIVPTTSRIPVQEQSLGEPVVALQSTGDAIVALGTSGKVTACGATLVAVDTSAIGRVHALFPGVRTGSAIVAGTEGYAVLVTGDRAALAAVVVDGPALRGVAPFHDRERALIYADGGDAWIADAGLARVARLRVRVVGAAATPDGTVLAWTGDGELHVVAHDGAIRRIGERDIVLAAADLERAGGYIAIHWSASDGARVSRGRSAWT